MPKDLEDLLERYRARLADNTNPPGSRELAEMEDEIWELHKRIAGRGATKTAAGERRDWFSKQFGGSAVPYEKRGTILRSGEWAWQCFERIDNGTLNYTNATFLIRNVKHAFRSTGVAPSIVMAKALELYDGTSKSLDDLNKAVVVQKKVSRPANPHQGTPPDETAPFTNNATASSKEFRARINHVVLSYLDHVFQQNPVTDFYKGQLEDDFMAAIDVSIETLRRNIQSSKRHVRKEIMSTVSEQEFNLACEVLSCSFIFGDRLTEKDERLITRRYQRRAKETHPDQNGEEYRDEYERVNKAYEVLRTYIRIRKEAS
jgi:hypothetical protein